MDKKIISSEFRAGRDLSDPEIRDFCDSLRLMVDSYKERNSIKEDGFLVTYGVSAEAECRKLRKQVVELKTDLALLVDCVTELMVGNTISYEEIKRRYDL